MLIIWCVFICGPSAGRKTADHAWWKLFKGFSPGFSNNSSSGHVFVKICGTKFSDYNFNYKRKKKVRCCTSGHEEQTWFMSGTVYIIFTPNENKLSFWCFDGCLLIQFRNTVREWDPGVIKFLFQRGSITRWGLIQFLRWLARFSWTYRLNDFRVEVHIQSTAMLEWFLEFS